MIFNGNSVNYTVFFVAYPFAVVYFDLGRINTDLEEKGTDDLTVIHNDIGASGLLIVLNYLA